MLSFIVAIIIIGIALFIGKVTEQGVNRFLDDNDDE